jgi:hypothetical protein
MSAKAKIEVVPTAKDRLREVQAKHKSFGATWSDVTAKIAKLAPFEDAVAQAREELQEIERADADALRAWVDRGAVGSPPVSDATARLAVARKIASAEASLKAAGVAKGSLESQLTTLSEEFKEFGPELRTAQMEVIGEEIYLAIEKMRHASAALLESEAYHLALLKKLRQIRELDAGGRFGALPSPPVALTFDRIIVRINEINKLPNEERMAASKTGNQRAQQVLDQLLADEDPQG